MFIGEKTKDRRKSMLKKPIAKIEECLSEDSLSISVDDSSREGTARQLSVVKSAVKTKSRVIETTRKYIVEEVEENSLDAKLKEFFTDSSED